MQQRLTIAIARLLSLGSDEVPIGHHRAACLKLLEVDYGERRHERTPGVYLQLVTKPLAICMRVRAETVRRTQAVHQAVIVFSSQGRR